MSEKRFWVLTLSGLALLTVMGAFFANHYYIDQRVQLASDRLLLLSNLRRDALDRYLQTTAAELSFWSANRKLIVAQTYFRNRWQESEEEGGDPGREIRQRYIEDNPYPRGERLEYEDAGDGITYSLLHTLLHSTTQKFVQTRGYYDFFLIDPLGNIAYSVAKEDDYGTNLLTGPWKDTGLGSVFRRALAAADEERAVFSDIVRYGPSNDEPAMFMGRAMHSEDGSLLGVLAFQVPIDSIVEIMQFSAGMGRTGETYLVGDDLLMRSDSRFSETSTILQTRVDTDSVKRALRGEYGVLITPDYRGQQVLSAYSSLQVGEHTWAVIAEIDRDEILEMAASERPFLAGLMLFLYGLGVGSAWFVRRADPSAELAGMQDLDDGMDIGDI
jgi:methyl-accepting chemotaxis protein